MNPKFRRNKFDYENETSSPSSTSNQNNGTSDHSQENQTFLLNNSYNELDMKTQHDAMRLLRNFTADSNSSNEFLKAIFEQEVDNEKKRIFFNRKSKISSFPRNKNVNVRN